MYRIITLSLMMAIPCVQAAQIRLSDKSVVGRGKLGELALYHSDDEGYSAMHNGIEKLICPTRIDPVLRKLNSTSLEILQEKSDFVVSEDSRGELTLKLQQKLNGGGLGGTQAGFIAAKFVTHFVGHGLIWGASALISMGCPPAGALFKVTATATLTPFIEAASNVAGLAGGIVGGTLTGPV
jgi:hypothetical protein